VIFSRLADSLALPAPQTYGLYHTPSHGTTWDLQRPLRTSSDLLEELRRLRPSSIVLKPIGGNQGHRLVILEHIDHDSGAAITRTGEVTSLAAAVAEVDPSVGMGGCPGYLLQECLDNHPLLEELAPYATNTLRVQSVLADDGEVHLLGAVLRLGRKGNSVDSFSQGGVAVHVDTRTGTTGRGLMQGPVRFVSQHPDTHADLAGRTVPFWDEVVSLVARGAGSLTGLRSIGWDIAVTPAGPLVVEANNDWGLQILQAFTGGYLADPAFRRLMADLRVPLPSGKLGIGLVGRWLWPLMSRIRR
jgi:hypothetical protein